MFDGDVDDMREFEITNDFPIGGLMTGACRREKEMRKAVVGEEHRPTQIELIVENNRWINREKFLSIDNRTNIRLCTNKWKERMKCFETSAQCQTGFATGTRESIVHSSHFRGGIEENAFIIIENNFTKSFDDGNINIAVQGIFPMNS